MTSPKEIEERLFAIDSEQSFNACALDVFRFQYTHNPVYRSFVDALGVVPATVSDHRQIPFLPIEFFKSKDVYTGDATTAPLCFTSSATTGAQVSRHLVKEPALYERSFLEAFRLFYGDAKDYCILALLPNYLERTGSSLVYMAEVLIRASGHPQSGFFLYDYEQLERILDTQKQNGQKTILLGVTYALLDIAERGLTLGDNIMVMETGGMKGRRKEMIKEELYAILQRDLHTGAIHSEYGMTELLSQAYSKGAGRFDCPPWMRILIRDANDPFAWQPPGRSGGINVIDLANLYSCSFIATKDLGKQLPHNQVEVLGRFDNSDIRGCNLMVG